MQDQFKGLHEKLTQITDWPKLYLFKFIIPNDNQKLAQIEALFEETAQVTINKSRTGKYLSISGKEVMVSPEDVIRRYEEASKIEGVISL